MLVMLRGELWWVDFNPSIGDKAQKIRPAVIVSNNAANKAMNRVQVIPTTSNTAKCYRCEAYIEVDGKVSKVMTDQIATVSKLRLKNKIGKASAQDMLNVERAIKLQLDL